MLGDPLANGRTSHLLPTLPFIRPFLLSLFLPPPLRLFLTSFPRSAVPWFSQTHNIGVPPIHLFLSFSPFFLLFSLPFFSLFFFFLSSSRKRTLPSVAVPSRFSFNHSSAFTTLLVIAENGGGCARNRPIEREREKEYPDREFSNYGANKFIGFISIFFRFCAAFVQTPAVLFFFALDYSMEVCFRKRNVDNRFPDSDVVTTLRTRISFRPLFIYRVYGSPPPLGYELLGRKKFKEIRMGFNFRESVSPKRRGYLSAENFSFL